MTHTSEQNKVERIGQSLAISAGAGTEMRSPGLTLDWLAPAALSLMLLLATWYQGAFALRHWAPVALLALVILAAGAATGGLQVPERAARVALVGLWGFAAWALLSGLWAESPARAIEGGIRAVLYAALFTVPCAMTWSGRSAARVGGVVMAGIGAIASMTLIELMTDPESPFLAGRLDDPVGYRNATACLFALSFWPFVSAAARRRLSPVLRALALAAGALVVGLAFLTESRGVVLGLALGGIVALGLGPDRIRRAWAALVLLGGMSILSDRLLTPFRAFSDRGEATAADISTATDALILLVAGAFAVGLIGALLDGGLRLDRPARLAVRRVLALGLVIATVAAAVGAIAAVGNPVDFTRDRIDEFRSLETTAPGESRLTFGGGQRSDLWRVALLEFADRPVTGVGEGNYLFRYYEERRTDRNLSTPHSLVFSILAELGAVGLICMVVFLVALTAAVVRGGAAHTGRRWWASALLAAGVVGLGQATVDWIWLIPGVLGVSFLALGLGLAAMRGDPPEIELTKRPLARLAPAVLVGVLALVTVSLYVGDVFVRKARATDAGEATKRLDAARTAESLLPWSVVPHELQAGALEELGRRQAARRELNEALELEPHNFVTFALLGDLEVRAGREDRARAYYRRALQLNPRDVGLRKLSRGEFGQ